MICNCFLCTGTYSSQTQLSNYYQQSQTLQNQQAYQNLISQQTVLTGGLSSSLSSTGYSGLIPQYQYNFFYFIHKSWCSFHNNELKDYKNNIVLVLK